MRLILQTACLLPLIFGGFLGALDTLTCEYGQTKLCGENTHTCLDDSDHCWNICEPTSALVNCSSSCRVRRRPMMVTDDSKRTHFRASPLSFYTLDGRNKRFFNAGMYGIRLSWLFSDPPSNARIGDVDTPWQRRGSIPTRKKGWPRTIKHACIDVALPNGTQQTISVGGFTYDIKIPSAGRSHIRDDILFIGDVNINEDGIWGKIGTRQVLRDVLKESAAVVFFGGDIFYHDDPFIEDIAWPSLDESARGISEHLVVAIPGNHDYEQGGCIYCSWRGSRKCYDGEANAFWVPAFFASDGMKPFYDDGGEGDTKGCAVPLEFTLQILVIGRTVLLTGDNVWSPAELDRLVNWNDLIDRLSTIDVSTIIVATHWNQPGLGAVSSTEAWVAYVASKLSTFRVFGNTNHVHRNGVERSEFPQVVSSGQNGMRDWSSPSRECRGSPCCPSLWLSTMEWKAGGWLKGQVCGDLFVDTRFEPTEIDELQQRQLHVFNEGSHYTSATDDVIYTHAPPFITDSVLVGVRFSAMYAIAASPIGHESLPMSISSRDLTAEYVTAYGISDGFPHCDNLALMNIPFLLGYTCWIGDTHPMKTLSFPIESLLGSS